MRSETRLLLLNNVSLILFIAVLGVFGLLSDTFLSFQNLKNILVQSSALAIVATGVTFVLLTGGVDLSVGSIMFLAVAVSGKMVFQGGGLFAGLMCALAVGLALGALNGFLISRIRMVPFIVTLAMLFVGRGLGLWYTKTRAMNMPESVTDLGSAVWLALPLPLWIMFGIVISAHLLLTRTPFGIQIYAAGQDPEAARKAGIRVRWILFRVYLMCGFCAALSGLISLTQTGAVSPSFGQQKEFSAIAAAVLGGTSLFGGRGNVLPGTLLGAVLIQTVENGLVILNVDPYVHGLITSGIIFLAVFLDAVRTGLVTEMTRRKIRPLEKQGSRKTGM